MAANKRYQKSKPQPTLSPSLMRHQKIMYELQEFCDRRNFDIERIPSIEEACFTDSTTAKREVLKIMKLNGYKLKAKSFPRM